MQVEDPGFDELEKADVRGTFNRLRELERLETIRVRGPQCPADTAALEAEARRADLVAGHAAALEAAQAADAAREAQRQAEAAHEAEEAAAAAAAEEPPQ
jgi:hypothetical protein